MKSNLSALSNELENAIERAAPHVVAVHGRPHISSSGILWRDGVIVTSEHTLQRGEDIRITLPDGQTVDATLAGSDAGTDISVLRTDHKTAAMPIQPPASLKPGQIVLSLGRSRDSGINAAMGIMSAVSGEWRPWRGGRLEAYLRLDLTLFPASAGGPVITPAGEFVGMATPALSRRGAARGTGFHDKAHRRRPPLQGACSPRLSRCRAATGLASRTSETEPRSLGEIRCHRSVG